MAVPTIRATGSATTQYSSPLVPANPTHAAGDLLIVVAGGTGTGAAPSIAAPTGGAWTLIGQQTGTQYSGTTYGCTAVYAIRATSAAMSDPSMVVSGTTNAYCFTARVISITAGTWYDTGTLTDAWEDVTYAINSATSGNVAVDATGLATVGADRLCIAHCFAADNASSGITNDASYSTAGTDEDSPTGADCYMGTRYLSAPSTGGGGATFTFTGGGVATTRPPCMVVAFALKPSATFAASETDTTTLSDSMVSGMAFAFTQTDTTTLSDEDPVSIGTGGGGGGAPTIGTTYTATNHSGSVPAFSGVSYSAGDLLLVMGSTQDNAAVGVTGGTSLGTWTSRGATQHATDGWVAIYTNVATAGASGVNTIQFTGPTISGAATLTIISNADTENLSGTGSMTYSATDRTPSIVQTLVGSNSYMFGVWKSNGRYLTAPGRTSVLGTDLLYDPDSTNDNTYTFMRSTDAGTGSTEIGWTCNDDVGVWGISLEIRGGASGGKTGTQTDTVTLSDACGAEVYEQFHFDGNTGTENNDPSGPSNNAHRFHATVDGSVVGVTFYKSTNEQTTTTVGLYLVSNQSLLASKQGTVASGSGWRTIMFDTPVDITASTVYEVVQYFSDASFYFTKTYAPTVPDEGHLSMDTVGGNHGFYNYTSSLAFCSNNYDNLYWLSPLFKVGAASGAKSGTETDTVTLSDIDVKGMEFPWTETDTVTASDTDRMGLALPFTETDTATPTDTDTPQYGIRYTETDTTTATDPWAGITGLPAYTQTDTTTATDTDAPKYGIGYTETDSATATDADEFKYGIQYVETDTTSASDTGEFRTGIPAYAETDSTAATDDWPVAFGLGLGSFEFRETDSTTATDSGEFRTGIPSYAETDAAPTTDVDAPAYGIRYAETDAAPATDTDAPRYGIGPTETDTATVSDVVASRFGIAFTSTDSTAASDTWPVAFDLGPNTFSASETDTVTATDTDTYRSGLPSYAETDTTSATDADAMGVAFSRVETDTTTATDVHASKYGIGPSQTDTIAVSDADASAFGIRYTQTDSAPASDVDAHQIGAAISVTETDTTTASDTDAFWAGSVPSAGVGWANDSSGAYLYRSSSLPLWTDSTITGWFYWNDDQNDSTVYWMKDGAGNAISLTIKHGGDVVVRVNNGWGDSSTIGTISTGAWYFFAIRVTTNLATGYISSQFGGLSAGQSASKPTTGTCFEERLGYDDNAGSGSFGGYVAWVRTWSGGLTTTQMLAEKYSSTAIVPGPDTDSPFPDTAHLNGWSTSGSIANGPAAPTTFSSSQTDTTTASDVESIGVGKFASQADTTTASDAHGLGTYIQAATLEATLLMDGWALGITGASRSGTQSDQVIPSEAWAIDIVRSTFSSDQTDTIVASDLGAVLINYGNLQSSQDELLIPFDACDIEVATGAMSGSELDHVHASDGWSVALGTGLEKRFFIWNGSGWV